MVLRGNKLKVLVVDNDINNLIKIESLLKDLEITVLKAQSGREALGHTLNNEIFLVIMEIEMEKMNGFETAEIMRKNNNTKNNKEE